MLALTAANPRAPPGMAVAVCLLMALLPDLAHAVRPSCPPGKQWSAAQALAKATVPRGSCCNVGWHWSIAPLYSDDTGLHGGNSAGCCPEGKQWYGSGCEQTHVECAGDDLECRQRELLGRGVALSYAVTAATAPAAKIIERAVRSALFQRRLQTCVEEIWRQDTFSRSVSEYSDSLLAPSG